VCQWRRLRGRRNCGFGIAPIAREPCDYRRRCRSGSSTALSMPIGRHHSIRPECARCRMKAWEQLLGDTRLIRHWRQARTQEGVRVVQRKSLAIGSDTQKTGSEGYFGGRPPTRVSTRNVLRSESRRGLTVRSRVECTVRGVTKPLNSNPRCRLSYLCMQ
jgi:hypothetical protein